MNQPGVIVGIGADENITDHFSLFQEISYARYESFSLNNLTTNVQDFNDISSTNFIIGIRYLFG